jgi:Ca-activated chloride channel family protein
VTFVQPLALVALLAVPLAWGLARLESRRRATAEAAYGGGPDLRPPSRPGVRRGREAVLLLALTALVLAAARPAWGYEEAPLVRRGIDVVIALDVSRSMTATDVPLSRAAAASTGLHRLLRALPGDRAGLVIFAGTAFARAPLTHDLDALGQLVAQAQGESALLDPGTDLALALEAALTALDVEDRAATQVIVLVSDGEHIGRDLDATLRRARDAGVRVYTVAAGTEEGGEMPRLPGRAGPGESSRPDRTTLRRVAEATGGSTRELTSIAGLAVEFSRLRQTTFEGAEERVPAERFSWFIGAALALLALHTLTAGTSPLARGLAPRRQRALAAAGAGALLLGACAGAEAWQANDAANRAYEQGQFDDAIAAYERTATLVTAPEDVVAIVYNRGNTLHRLRRYEEATVASARAVEEAPTAVLRDHAQYALGNHAYRRGDLDAARIAYRAVLLADPSDEDARHNLELVLLQQQPRQQPASGATGQQGPATATPPAQPNATGQPGQPGTPAATSPGGGQAPPGATPGAGTALGEPLTEEAAQAALATALQGLGDSATLDEALAVLDRLRQLDTFERLQGGRRSGSLPDR